MIAIISEPSGTKGAKEKARSPSVIRLIENAA